MLLNYIINFDRKGVPVIKDEDNESIVKNTDVETEGQENFPNVNKNKYIQKCNLHRNCRV